MEKPEPVIGMPPANAPQPPQTLAWKDDDSGQWHNLPLVECNPYTDRDGAVMFYTVRVNLPGLQRSNGKPKKMFGTFSWCTRDRKWVRKAWETIRPLYGLPWLADSSCPVVVVEGEKKCRKVQEVMGEAVAAVTWANGGKSWSKADWTALAKRDVILWPDADKDAGVGLQTMLDIGRHIKGMGCIVSTYIPRGKPAGWDAYDATEEEVRTIIEEHIDNCRAYRFKEVPPAEVKPVANAPEPHPLTEDEAALMGATEDDLVTRFERMYSGRMLYDHDAGRWWMWRNGQWEQDRVDLARQIVREMCRTVSAPAKDAARLTKVSTWNTVVSAAQSVPALATTADRWDANPWVCGVPGGVVDLRTGIVRPAYPGDLVTKQLGCAPKRGTPRRWLEFLHEATGNDRDTVDYLQRLAGYCLTGSTKEQGLWFIYGQGGNGKGTFMSVLMRLLGTYALNSPAETFAAGAKDRHPEELARLAGARLVTVAETKTGGSWNEQRIKELTGGDPVTARYMNQNSFTYEPQFKLVMSGNHRPSLRVVDDAMRRRFHVVPFTRKPSRVDNELRDRLLTELPQIAWWAIQGCLDWQSRGMEMSRMVANETMAYLESQDTVGAWLQDWCVTEPGKWAPVGRLFASWSTYAEALGEHPGNAKSFSQEMQRRGFQPDRTNKVRVFRGVEIAGDGLSDGSERGVFGRK